MIMRRSMRLRSVSAHKVILRTVRTYGIKGQMLVNLQAEGT